MQMLVMSQSTPHTEACLREGRKLRRIVCVACGIVTTAPTFSGPRHHETAQHRWEDSAEFNSIPLGV